MKPLTLVAVVTLVVVVVAGIVVRFVVGADDTDGPPGGAITIDVFSSNTKENWINAVVDQFNQEQHKIAAGESIFVIATHVLSGGSQRDILAGKIQPTVWSAGDSSWVDRANVVWRDRTGRPLVSGHCASTILAPSGFAMWRPMAEALGWPDNPISWDDLVALSADPDGWAGLGHPQWGKFKFGHAHPTYSNVGLQMMTALVYSIVGSTSGLTPAPGKRGRWHCKGQFRHEP